MGKLLVVQWKHVFLGNLNAFYVESPRLDASPPSKRMAPIESSSKAKKLPILRMVPKRKKEKSEQNVRFNNSLLKLNGFHAGSDN